VGNEKPGDFGGGGTFEFSGAAAASAEPSKGAFDDPAEAKHRAFEPGAAAGRFRWSRARNTTWLS
jgi:hypothetical protein